MRNAKSSFSAPYPLQFGDGLELKVKVTSAAWCGANSGVPVL